MTPLVDMKGFSSTDYSIRQYLEVVFHSHSDLVQACYVFWYFDNSLKHDRETETWQRNAIMMFITM